MRFLDILMDEHHAFGTMLDVLDAMTARMSRGEDVPLEMLSGVVSFFDRFSDRHHQREETLLFPLLAHHGIGADQTVVNALASQHEAGRMYSGKMRIELEQIRDGNPEGAASWAADAAAFSELLREHIRIEDEYFYKLADDVLSKAEHERLAAQLERANSSPAAHAERERYLRMLDLYPAVVRGWAAGS
jgi:branched-chain amino acid transport system ATP-binding protein